MFKTLSSRSVLRAERDSVELGGKSLAHQGGNSEREREDEAKPQPVLNRPQHSNPHRIKKDDSRKERKEKIVLSFTRNQTEQTISPADYVMANTDEMNDDTDLCDGGGLAVIVHRHCCQEDPSQMGLMRVPNCCVICLDQYQPGQTLVWSKNEECQHVFHKHCLVRYLQKIHKRAYAFPCPCCRRDYITDIRIQKKRTTAETIVRYYRGAVSTISSPFTQTEGIEGSSRRRRGGRRGRR